eukprot:scaffold503_cov375-Pinguiococcus_pyrenoidosus.AAC.12
MGRHRGRGHDTAAPTALLGQELSKKLRRLSHRDYVDIVVVERRVHRSVNLSLLFALGVALECCESTELSTAPPGEALLCFVRRFPTTSFAVCVAKRAVGVLVQQAVAVDLIRRVKVGQRQVDGGREPQDAQHVGLAQVRPVCRVEFHLLGVDLAHVLIALREGHEVHGHPAPLL